MGFLDWTSGGSDWVSPDDLDRRRQVAQQMLNSALSGNTGSIGGGLAQLGNAIAGRIAMNRVDSTQKRMQSAASRDFSNAFWGNVLAPAASRETASAPASVPANVKDGIVQTANALGINPVDLATAISYETAGTFDPTKAGPTTKWGQHKGLIQFGQPQAQQYGVDWNNPVGSQLGANGAVAKYLTDAGVKPGMGLMDIYSAINAGKVGRYGASDAAAGGAPGTVADKVNNQMAAHRAKAMALLAQNGGATNDLVQHGRIPATPDMLQNPVYRNQLAGVDPKALMQPMANVQPAADTPATAQPPMGMSFNGPASIAPPVQQPVPQPQPQVIPAAAPPMQQPVQQRPMTAFERLNATAAGKYGSNTVGQPRAVTQNGGWNPFAPRMAQPPVQQPMPAGGPSLPQQTGLAQDGGTAPAGNDRLAVLQQTISSPNFVWMPPAQQKMVLDEYQRLYAEANPTEEQQIDLATKKAQLEKLQHPNVPLVNAGDGNLYDPSTGKWITAPNGGQAKPTAEQQNYNFAMDQLRKRGVPEDKLPSFQEWAKPKSRGIVFKGADGTEITIGGDSDGSGLEGTSIPAEVGARVGLGQEFIENDYPEIMKMIDAGDATGAIDYAWGSIGQGNSGIVQRRIATGVDALRRGLTGAGMSATESAEYLRRYSPAIWDTPETLRLKVEGLKRDLEAVSKGAIFGKAGKVGPLLPKEGNATPSPAPATPDVTYPPDQIADTRVSRMLNSDDEAVQWLKSHNVAPQAAKVRKWTPEGGLQ